MPGVGLIDNDQGLMYGTGLNWLEGGLGGDGYDNPKPGTIIYDRADSAILDRSGQEIDSRVGS